MAIITGAVWWVYISCQYWSAYPTVRPRVGLRRGGGHPTMQWTPLYSRYHSQETAPSAPSSEHTWRLGIHIFSRNRRHCQVNFRRVHQAAAQSSTARKLDFMKINPTMALLYTCVYTGKCKPWVTKEHVFVSALDVSKAIKSKIGTIWKGTEQCFFSKTIIKFIWIQLVLLGKERKNIAKVSVEYPHISQGVYYSKMHGNYIFLFCIQQCDRTDVPCNPQLCDRFLHVSLQTTWLPHLHYPKKLWLLNILNFFVQLIYAIQCMCTHMNYTKNFFL